MRPVGEDELLTEDLDDAIDINETAKYRLTPWGCLSVIFDDYGIDYSGVTPAIGKHLVEDFLTLMERSGYLEHISE